jgi:hypothetical protein
LHYTLKKNRIERREKSAVNKKWLCNELLNGPPSFPSRSATSTKPAAFLNRQRSFQREGNTTSLMLVNKSDLKLMDIPA